MTKFKNATIMALFVSVGLGFATKAVAAEEGSDTKSMPSKAVAVIVPTEGNEVKGQVTFTQTGEGTLIEARIVGLKPNAKHGFHIHELGDISSPDGKSTGGHFNPDGNDHAGPMDGKRHVGDLGNLEADAKGNATYKRVDKYVQVHGEHSILSRGITIHAGTDDLTSQPTGAAGARIGVGVIGLAK